MQFDDIISMIYRVPPYSRGKSVFVCDPVTAAKLRKIQDSEGQYLWADARSKTEDPHLLGYPIRADTRYAGLAFGPFPKLPEKNPYSSNYTESKNAN